MIPFNRQNLFGPEIDYIRDAYKSGRVSGGGKYTKACQELLEERFKARRILLTSSCSQALDMAAILSEVGPGDEVIMPSYTFVSTANAFVLRGARPVFCEIREDTLNMDETMIDSLVGPRTRAIAAVHYAGVGCEMDAIADMARRHGLLVVEDAAQGVNALYKGKYLGTLGHLGCFSFHETKNYSMGEGGALVINEERFLERAEFIRDKGTNRSRFLRGEIDKYTWVDLGSSFLPSEISAAVLWAQLEHLDEIGEKRKSVSRAYRDGLSVLEVAGKVRLQGEAPPGIEGNGHMFYVILESESTRDLLMEFLKERGVQSVFHYVPLHESEYYRSRFGDLSLPITESLSRRLLRLPLFFGLAKDEIQHIIKSVREFFGSE